MWRTMLAWLASLSADPTALDREAPKASAAVMAAYAAQAAEQTPDAVPTPAPETKCCSECGGKGYVVQPDGHRTSCPCPPTCHCKRASVSTSKSPGCADGKCPAPGASPASVSPSLRQRR